MKKILFLIPLLFLFVACGIDDAFKDEPELTTESGILLEQGDNDDLMGTHLLRSLSDEDLLVRSLTFNLSDLKYLENEVEIIGVLNEKDNVFEVTGITVLSKANPEDIEKQDTDFIEYTNRDFGIRLNYYNDWYLIEDSSRLTFLAPSLEDEADKISIEQISFRYEPALLEEEEETDDPLTAYFAKNYPEKGDLSSLFRKIGKEEMSAVEIEDGFSNVDYYLYRSGLIYKFSFLYSDNNRDPENKRIFNEMLSSFQFLPFEISDSEEDISLEEEEVFVEESVEETVEKDLDSEMKMVSFESLPYHFAGKYPASWYYAGSRSSKEGVLHHYAFSDEPIEGNNELIGLDVLAGNSPELAPIVIPGVEGVVGQTFNGVLTVYRTVNEQTYRMTADSDYRDIVLKMIAEIREV
jgi:hypothetical protein